MCNLGCAAVFLQFWNDCANLLGANKALYANTVAACQATESSARIPPSPSPSTSGGTGASPRRPLDPVTYTPPQLPTNY